MVLVDLYGGDILRSDVTRGKGVSTAEEVKVLYVEAIDASSLVGDHTVGGDGDIGEPRQHILQLSVHRLGKGGGAVADRVAMLFDGFRPHLHLGELEVLPVEQDLFSFSHEEGV